MTAFLLILAIPALGVAAVVGYYLDRTVAGFLAAAVVATAIVTILMMRG